MTKRKPKSGTTGYINGLMLHEGPKGKAYYYQFKFAGEVYRGSTDTAIEREAIAFLEALKTELREKKKRLEVTRRGLPTLYKVYEDWKTEMTSTASPAHMKSVDSYFRLHIAPHLGILKLNQVSTAQVEKCRATYLDGGGTHGGANSLLIALNALFGWAIRHRLIATKPYAVKKLKVQRKPRPVLPGGLAPKFLTAIDRATNVHVRAAVRMMVGLGLREDEALTARWEWLDTHRATYTAGKTKGREAVALDVPDWLLAYLKGLRPKKAEGLMFPAEDGEPHRAGFTRKAVARASKAVGLKLTPHRLRATFATLHSDAGTAPAEIQRMLRHKNITTTQRYIETGRRGMETAQRRVAEMMNLQAPKQEAKPKPKGKAKPKPTKSSQGNTKGNKQTSNTRHS